MTKRRIKVKRKTNLTCDKLYIKSLRLNLGKMTDIKKAFIVSRNVFYPKPNVDSAIVIFEKNEDTELQHWIGVGLDVNEERERGHE